MPLVFTEPADVTKRWVGDDPIPADEAQIETFLEDAEDTILREFPDAAARIAADPPTLTLARVKKVAARMVIRFLRNPDGAVTATETNGPFSENRTLRGEGEIVLTDEDRADLSVATGRKRAFTINTSPNPVDPGVWGPAYDWGVG